jgi:phenylalanyl-tRNA synthetase beta chain
MKVSLHLAQEYSNIDLIKTPTDELVKLATERLGGVEGYNDFTNRYDKIVIVKIISCVQHPNADKLTVCLVDDASITPEVKRDKNGYVQVVCGAPNVRVGMLAVWIPPGASVPATFEDDEPFVLGSKELRGTVSNGMLASAKELDLSEDVSGLLEINPNQDNVKPGMLLNKLPGVHDVVIDIENKMFTHRPDCFGQLGVARELAGIQGLPFESPKWYFKPENLPGATGKLSVKVKNEIQDLVPRYTAIVLENVMVRPSPLWMQIALRRLGIRSINNVVDTTNFMMALTAQPLHAFDYDKIAKGDEATIIVRKPKEGEKLHLLDGKTIEPHQDAALICNEDGPIALGGIMGGGNSEVDENTTRIVLECATFDMYNIRRTSMHHGLFTDAVTRFNKGQPAAQLLPVLHKTVKDFVALNGASVASEIADSHPKISKPKTVTIGVDFINKRLGSDLTFDEIATILSNVELGVKVTSDTLEVSPPFWRTDIEIPEDIVEEVGRLHGFNNLPITLPTRDITPVYPDHLLKLEQQIREVLSRAGANEVLTYSFVHGNLLQKVGQDPNDAYQLRNALSPDLQYYRMSLVPSLLERIHPNTKVGYNQFALFEMGKIHRKSAGLTDEKVPQEADVLALVHADTAKTTNMAYYMAKRTLDFLAESLQLHLEYEPVTGAELKGHPYFDANRTAWVKFRGADLTLGLIGEYQPQVTKALKLPEKCAGFEVSLNRLLEGTLFHSSAAYKPISKYPSSSQDITLKIASSVSYGQLFRELINVLESSDYIWQLSPLGIYQKEDDTHKNVSFHLTLASYDHTLKTSEVSEVISSLSDQARKILKAEKV